jgi:heme exporter protein A
LITLKGIKKNFGLFEALKGINLDVSAGDFVTVVGQNGAGKSTLLKIMAGLMAPSYGEIIINGKIFKNGSGMHREEMGVVAHQACLYPSLSAYANLLFFGKLFLVKELKSRVEEVLKRVGLWERKDDPVTTYSCGMKQRLAISRAILHHPNLLLLDEPFSGLDPRAVEDLKKLLTEFKEEGKTIVMITHQLDAGYELADRITVMHKGRVALDEEKSKLSWEQFHEFCHAAGDL